MLKQLISKLVNSLWECLCIPESKRFFKSVKDLRKTQEKVLLSIVTKNSNTHYGKKHNFHNIKNIQDFQHNVPLSNYEDFEMYINKIAAGESKVLTAEPLSMFELSSGSTAASKLIPYTKSLKEEFQRGLKVWIHDLFKHYKGLFWGKIYFSISPVAQVFKRTSGGIPIGFEEDSEYFGVVENILLNQIFAVPSDVKKISDIDSFRYVTLLFLLKEKHLVLISIWNPTFLTLLLNHLDDWKDQLIVDLSQGTIHPPEGSLDIGLRHLLEKKLGKNRKRAKELSDLMNKNKILHDPVTKGIWPYLTLISCWTSAYAKTYVSDIMRYFPGVDIQGKGLLATEGIISFPLVGKNGYVLSAQSHFFEFIEYKNEETSDNNNLKIKLASELEIGKTYAVVITTGGGFYRYQLHDLIQVLGFVDSCPLVDFVGKEGNISDYFGEKLNESHVHDILTRVFVRYKLNPSFYMMAPEKNMKDEFCYVLYIEPNLDERQYTKQLCVRLKKEIEDELMKNYHYKYSRHLNQLHSFTIFLIAPGNGIDTYLNICKSHGQRVGNIKPVILHKRTGWSREFSGEFINEPVMILNQEDMLTQQSGRENISRQ